MDSAGAEATADVLINLVQEGVTGEAPALQEIGDRSVEEAREYRLQIRATNPDGPPPAFTDPVGLPDTAVFTDRGDGCLLYTSPSPRDKRQSRMPSSA